MSDREPIQFADGMYFEGSNCDIKGIGHDIKNALVGYDFKGQVTRICPRPWCMEVIDHVAVDDLSGKEFDDLTAFIQGVSHYRDE